MSRDLVILVPMLGRAHTVAPLLDSIRTSCDARVLFLLTPGDDEVRAAVSEWTHGGPNGPIASMFVDRQERGDYARKINHGYRSTVEPYLFTGACDIRFQPGWYEAAIRHFGNPRVGVVGTNDVHSRRAKIGDDHATHFLVRRTYVDECGTIDRPGEVMPECYLHEYVDDEMVGTAKARGAYVREPDSIVEHLHPYWGQGEWDDLYRQMGERVGADAPLFQERHERWR